MATFQKRGTRWRAIVRKKGHPAQSKSFTTKVQAQRWAAQIELDIENGVFSATEPGLTLTVAELCKLHVKHLERSNDHRHDTQMRSNSKVVSEAFECTLADLSLAMVREFAEARVNVDKVSPATVRHNLMFLSGAISTGVYEAGVPESLRNDYRSWLSVLKRSGLSRPPVSRDRRISPEELDLIYTHVQHNNALVRISYRHVIEFAIESCMRLGEICRLKWEDYDAGKSTIIIRDRKHPTDKKGNHQTVPLLAGAKRIIEEMPRQGEFIFPYSAESVSAGFRRICKFCEITDLKFHDLRHEGVSRLFEKGMPIQEVAMISGHKDWSSLRRYTNLRPADVAEKWS
ncbi:site-specific integrase [Oceanospirillum sediminis]|uniref:Tyrosine-type recombinase/integrase n=1 Tax=Oceanospirillum sediminis TaxID=2760088 RepID=A0A839IQ50_9GAMM|nr:site-specific integrase [Oceanospirillum sediminis]MBB1487088.1 tyrosine-type recombinase/integrase [Oceanospirillum sediminis]